MKLIEFPGPQTWKTKYVQNSDVNEPSLNIFFHSHAQKISSQRNKKKISVSHEQLGHSLDSTQILEED
jgi:hypothetical protein